MGALVIVVELGELVPLAALWLPKALLCSAEVPRKVAGRESVGPAHVLHGCHPRFHSRREAPPGPDLADGGLTERTMSGRGGALVEDVDRLGSRAR